MFAHLLLGGLCFAASILTLTSHLLDEAVRGLTVGLLTTTVLVGALAYQVLARLDQPDPYPTSRTETRP